MSVLASALESVSAQQKFCFSFADFSFQIYAQYTLIFFLVLSYAEPIPHCYNHLFLYDFLFTQSETSIGVLDLSNSVLKKITENFWKLCNKRLMLKSFKVHQQHFSGWVPKTYLEQLFCREPVSACFCKKEFHSRRYLRNFRKF